MLTDREATLVEKSRYRDSPQLDAFGRLRVSNPQTIFDSKLLGDKQEVFWSEQITNLSGNATSTHSTTEAGVVMHVEAGDSIIRQTFMRFNYQPGKSQELFMTAVPGAGQAGVIRRIGLFEGNNGLFFEENGTAIRVVERKGAVDTPVDQSLWNKDIMNGGGPSGIVLNFARVQFFYLDFEWQGTGRVRMGFIIGGTLIVVHEFLHSNIDTSVYISNPNLPLRYEISSTGPAANLIQICVSVASEGGQDPTGIIRSASTNGVHVDANVADTIYAVVGIRLKSGFLFASIESVAISMISETNDDFEWLMFHNPVIAGAFTYSDETNSPVQAARGATANVVTGGIRLAGGFASIDTQQADLPVKSRLRLGAAIDGSRDEHVLCVRPLSANADIQGALIWSELL